MTTSAIEKSNGDTPAEEHATVLPATASQWEDQWLQKLEAAVELTERELQMDQAGHLQQVSILGIPINNVVMRDAVNLVIDKTTSTRPHRVSFVNADCVNIASRHSEYRDTLVSSDLCFADGIGMKIAGSALGVPVVDNVNGTDMLPHLCESLQRHNKSLFLLGGRPGVAERVGQWAKAHYPRLTICGVQHGYFSDAEEATVVSQISSSNADVLLAALGAPRQELWLDNHLRACGASVGIGVGGLFDFYSGDIPRAPMWMRRWKLEWVFRLLQEPGRLWKRYLMGNVTFLIRVGVECLRMAVAKWLAAASQRRRTLPAG